MSEAKKNMKVTLPSSSMLPIWRVIYQAMVARLSKRGLPFSVAAATLHLYVHPEDAEPARLADAIFIPRQSMTFTLDALERLRLASRTPHPADRRKKIIVLSAKGQKLGRALLDDLLAFEATAFEAFPADDSLRLKSLSEKLAEAMTRLT